GAEELGEHLADLGRGGEVAGGAERIVGRIVAVLGMTEAELHVLRDRHRSGDLDAPANLSLERGHLVRGHVRPNGSRRNATAIKAIPAMSNGSDSSVPMVSPPQRKPSCGPGPRNCPQIERATP